MNNEELDTRLLDALAQIEDLQRTVEEQKNNFEGQIVELKVTKYTFCFTKTFNLTYLIY